MVPPHYRGQFASQEPPISRSSCSNAPSGYAGLRSVRKAGRSKGKYHRGSHCLGGGLRRPP